MEREYIDMNFEDRRDHNDYGWEVPLEYQEVLKPYLGRAHYINMPESTNTTEYKDYMDSQPTTKELLAKLEEAMCQP